jgi:hypothetical protein
MESPASSDLRGNAALGRSDESRSAGDENSYGHFPLVEPGEAWWGERSERAAKAVERMFQFLARSAQRWADRVASGAGIDVGAVE